MKYYKITVLAIFCITACIFNVSAQKKEGDIEIKAGNYQKAITYYHNENLSSGIALQLAKCYAMTEQIDSAFYLLNFLIEREKDNLPFSTLEGIKEFEKIKKNVEWENLRKKCIQFRNAHEAKLNIPLRDSILEMRRIDNYYQEKFDSIMFTNDSISIKSFKEKWKATVKENDLILTIIIDKYGWPTRELVGNFASSEVFFIVQHSSDLELQKKCLILLKKATDKNTSDLVQIAYLEDRILVKSGQKQLYGTQYKKGKLYPIQDPDNLNKRRAQIGLGSIQFIQSNSYYQNLIPNYGFELYPGDECPRYLRDIDGKWENIGGESFSIADDDTISYSLNYIHICKDQSYFNSCTGNACIRYWTIDFSSVTPELFQVEMKDSLLKGKEYLIEYYIRTNSKNKTSVTNKRDVCIFLLKDRYHFTTKYDHNTEQLSLKENFKISPAILFSENKPVEDFSEWTKVSNKYIAKGGEKYFLIGRYGKVKYNTEINLDNITVSKIYNNNINIENAKIGEAFILENISFELNSSNLKESSYPTLNHLVGLFNIYPNLIIEIAGHTDNIGDKAVNVKLSKNRAKSVVDYLISEGIKPNQVQSKGYGESFPISDNTSEKGRKNNRRVEFKILKR
ncbi:MAG: OmpA family protein [Bacteroidales bacterium]|nr:OmpA family protein [Bacteroidales bacterium]